MKVKELDQMPSECRVDDIQHGDPFRYDTHIYIRAKFKCKDITQDKPLLKVFCVNVNTGGVRFLDGKTQVEPLWGAGVG